MYLKNNMTFVFFAINIQFRNMELYEHKINLAPVVRPVLAKPPGLNKENSENCWENNISEQFPIQLTNQVDGDAEVSVKQPYQGYVIKITIVDLKMNGESYIFSDKGIHIATLTFVDGIASGPCTINDDSGLSWFGGRFKNSYCHGINMEYDKNGNVHLKDFMKEERN